MGRGWEEINQEQVHSNYYNASSWGSNDKKISVQESATKCYLGNLPLNPDFLIGFPYKYQQWPSP